MICPECRKEGRRSTIHVGPSFSTLTYFTPFYDEDGIYHHHDANSITTSYNCSNGHLWSESHYAKCPSCPWPNPKEPPSPTDT